jgi:AAA15 family ATPase/GTPase
MDGYKQICIELIRLFDPQIEDLVYMRNELTGKAVEYIKSKKLGLMPLSTYGDGIKKVLSLANAIVESAGGILLIDEIDTSIHYKYYDDIFNFLIKACMKFDVQVFITTHSKEAIDEILKTQKYDEKQKTKFSDPINVITFRKDENGNIRSRSMSGFDVYSNRELFDFEVRL